MTAEMQKTEQQELDRLWMSYREKGGIEIRNELVLKYSWLVKRIILRFRGRTSNYVQLDDLINHGMIALIDAVERFDPGMGNKFETFASIKIRGAAIDCMREQDWIPRSQRNQAKELENIYHELYTSYGREPTRTELAERMDVPVPHLEKIMQHRQNAFVLSYEEAVHEKGLVASALASNSSREHMPEQSILQTEMKEQLAKAVDRLSERERLVISLYYTEDLKLREISEVLGVSESRVSQIHSQALLKLRHTITDYQEA